ncbi:hypothetical protein BDB01DRAFT_831603 [Pilobolus umbonatus]|nr:hypothetical protein BDB01DRAFT_831603 [Pilobolus umbonatus]
MDFQRGCIKGKGGDNHITRTVKELFSFDSNRQRRIIDRYYYNEASFNSPLISVQGSFHIRQVLLVWKLLNRYPPRIDKICLDGTTCVVFMTQILCPRLFPFVSCIHIPVIVTLEFKETDQHSGSFKVIDHRESWTIEGIIESIPLLSYWYNHILRSMMGRILSATGLIIENTPSLSCKDVEYPQDRHIDNE